MLRIIAGKHKGAKLQLPPEAVTRPSSARLREAVFNILDTLINWNGIAVCDAFAGSGALGLEALSRGANAAVFCEKSQDAFNVLRKNIKHVLKDNSCAIALHNDFFYMPAQEFDLIFLDPPYQAGFGSKVLELVHAKKLLRPNGVVVLEELKGFNTQVDNFEIFERRVYGSCQVSFYRLLSV